MDNYDDAIARLDDELHGQNYELYTYLHDVISVAQADNTRLREQVAEITLRRKETISMCEQLREEVEELEGEVAPYRQDGMERVNEVMKEVPVIAMGHKIIKLEAQLERVRELTEMDAMDGAIVFASGDKAIYVADILQALEGEDAS